MKYIQKLPAHCRSALTTDVVYENTFRNVFSVFDVLSVEEDGHCFYRCIADATTGDVELYMQVRQELVEMLSYKFVSPDKRKKQKDFNFIRFDNVDVESFKEALLASILAEFQGVESFTSEDAVRAGTDAEKLRKNRVDQNYYQSMLQQGYNNGIVPNQQDHCAFWKLLLV